MKNNLKKMLLITIIILLGFFIPKLIGFYSDFLWFKELGYQTVFLKTITSKLIIALCTFLPVFLISFFVLRFSLTKKSNIHIEKDNVIEIKEKNKTFSTQLNIIISFILAFLATSLTTNSLWEEILLFLNQVPFQINDPIFNKDVSFYIFNLSLYETIYFLFMFFFIVLTIISFIFTIFRNGLGKSQIIAAFKKLGYYIVAFFLLLIIGYRLKMFNVLFTPHSSFYGAGFTDLKVTRPYYYIAIITCIIAAITLFLAIKKKNNKLFLIGPIIFCLITIGGGITQNIVQKFIVQPNEIKKEEPYIANNIQMTLKAFGLDNIKEIDFNGETELSLEDLKESKDIINNIRINDARPAQIIFNQLQNLRQYYTFDSVDIDRYTINGKQTQVFLAAREINIDDLSSQAQTWINKHLKYTHGYGAVVAPVNTITPQGQPALLVKDIPPKSSVQELEIKRPEIYFGNLTDHYVIVNTTEKEFDYPVGSNNVETIYEGSAGIPLSTLNRLVFALKESSFKILVSSTINSDSKILLNRNILDRAKKIAPFLTYDNDPYLVINEGKLYWIIDAYTSSNKYPYSQPITTESWPRGINYIRNSVKVVIDAYNGKIDYYLIDENDPIAASYAKIFPGLFKSITEIPQGIEKHLRYPVDYFDIQTQIFQDYHMTNPRVFYYREDSWHIAKELYYENTQLVRPYYVNLCFPDSNELEFVLMRPFTPKNKDQMKGWLGARNDGDRYGQLVLFKFPKQKLMYGPMQIESRISQDSDISKELSLWDQKGSKVLRGNLLVIPIKDSIIYVEPLYIQADNENSLPEVKRIIVAYKDNIVMEKTLEDALYKIFGEMFSDISEEEVETSSKENLILMAKSVFEKAKSAAQSGKWAQYGEALEELEHLLEQLEQMTNQEKNN